MTDKAKIQKLVRIVSIDLDGDKVIERALWKIPGISHMFAHAIRETLNIPKNRMIGELSKEETKKIEDVIKNPKNYGFPDFLLNRRRDNEKEEGTHLSSSSLEISKRFDVKKMKEMRSYKGMRHSFGLKVRGQRTKSTGRKGSAVGVKRKKVLAKMQPQKKEGGGKGKK